MSTANELRQLKADELKGRVAELTQRLFDLKTKHSTGVLDSTADLMKTRREIARCLTVAREKELGLTRVARESPRAEPPARAGKAVKKARKKE